jgi:hypothetical protein
MIFLVLIWPFNFGPLSDVEENQWFTWVLALFILASFICANAKFRNDGYRKDLAGIGLSAPGP